jgi:hypothetical protein
MINGGGNKMIEIIFMPRGSGKLYFIKRYYFIPKLIKSIEMIKENKNES